MPPYKLAILTSHVIQYQDPLFRQIAAHPDIDLTVLFCDAAGARSYHDRDMGAQLRWDLELLQGYRHEFLNNYAPREHGFLRHVNPGIYRTLARGGYDAVLVMLGWGTLSAWLAFAACEALALPFFVYGDNSFIGDDGGVRRRIRRRILSALFDRASAFLVCGTMNGDFYAHYGADRQRFFPMPWAIDNDRFSARSTISDSERLELRRQHGIPPDRLGIVFAGKLIKRKNPAHLLDAVLAMGHRDRVAVIYIGDGVERPTLQAYAREHGLSAAYFTGFINQSELPTAYAMGDIFVLPSSFDPRGTVTNEAMACGLPVIVTNMVGVYGEGDIVRHGDNGFVYTVGDIRALAGHLDALADDDDLRAGMSRRSRERIAGWSYTSDVEGILAALRMLPGAREGSRAR
ncbi:MAG: glycosyltransferase family 4 protein [Gemmatimonadota bacterium]|nr:glycosyltransferase family 4 protein [Gemmatimonadota bacterium]